jgi:PAS domain S-box-containing protein
MPKKSILIADDDHGILDLLEEMLQREGYQVLLAQNGREAVDTAEKYPIDMAILDMKMPVMDGIEALKRIKEIDRSIEILTMTAYADLESLKQTVVEYGAVDYLLKPFHKSESMYTIRNALLKRDVILQKGFLKKELENRIVQLEKDFEERTRQLRESQIKYKEIVENSNEVIIIVQDGKMKFANPKTLMLTGYTREEILDFPFMEMVHPENRREVEDRHIKLMEGEKFPAIYSFQALRKNGESFWVENNAIKTIWEGKPAALFFMRDISQNKQVESALKTSEKKYSFLVENSPDIIYVLNHEGNFTFVGGGIKSLLGFNSDELIGKHFTSIIWPEDLDKALWHFNERRTGERATRMLELRLKTKKQKGAPFDINDLSIELDAFGMYSKPVSKKDKEFLGTYGVARDISRRKLVEEALRESEEKYRMLVENANDAIFIIQDKVIKFPNPKTEELTGFSAEELTKIPIADFIHPEDRNMVLEWGIRKLAREELPSTYTFRIINRSGEELWVQINLVLITWEGRAATLNFIRDITQERKLERQFQQAQKMEAVGTLAGGIAHDFNNLLTGVQGNTSLILLDVDPSHPHYSMLQGIEKQVLSGAKLTKQLLGYARAGNYDVKPLNLNRLVEETSETFGRTRKEITIHRELAGDMFSIEGDYGQIEQVLLNLYVNAADAMAGGGDLFLKTMNVADRDMKGKSYNVNPGNYVLFTVSDTGVGMDKKTQERIFEPFFTTKEMGKGTGLGLASVYGIIKAHGGYIDVDSEKGKGTTFSIFLPSSEKEVVKAKKIPAEILNGTETVLIVDDEDIILEIGSRLLKSMGYKVLLASSGEEALEIYKETKDNIDIVVLDLIMPAMGGGEVYNRLIEINPKVKVLLSSGYSMDGKAKKILARGCNGFIPKPFNMRLLSQKIRQILSKA